MRQCTKCKELKDEKEFRVKNKKTGQLQYNCQSCIKIYNKEHYLKIKSQRVRSPESLLLFNRKKELARRYVFDYLKSHPCIDCGEADPIVLEFDHVRGQKKFTISYAVNSGRSVSLIEEEVLKCDVRCSNCHQRITALRGNFWMCSYSLIG